MNFVFGAISSTRLRCLYNYLYLIPYLLVLFRQSTRVKNHVWKPFSAIIIGLNAKTTLSVYKNTIWAWNETLNRISSGQLAPLRVTFRRGLRVCTRDLRFHYSRGDGALPLPRHLSPTTVKLQILSWCNKQLFTKYVPESTDLLGTYLLRCQIQFHQFLL